MRGRCRFLLCPPCKVCPAKRPFFAARAMYKKKRSKLNSVKPDVELRPVTFLFVSVQSSLSPFSHFKKPPGISNPLPLLCVSSLHHPKSARSDANAQHPLPAKKTAESADTCHPPFGKCSFFPCRSDFVRIYYQTEALRNASSFPSGLPEELCGLSPPLVEALDRFYLPLGRASKTCLIQSPVSHWLEMGAERNACSLRLPHWPLSVRPANRLNPRGQCVDIWRLSSR